MIAYTGGASSGGARGGTAIARTWRGATTAEDADAYLEYLHRTGFRAFRDTPGNLGALALRRVASGRAEFLLVSFWDSEEAVRRFAGHDPERAVFYPEDERFLVERDEHVEHFEVVYRDDAGSGKWEAGSWLPKSHSPAARS